ncbi:MAG: T9SS type A sorting domain-containing protein [Bacteroidales bacterium]|nr:MAG: T9SS type A sorting domain-containing protein [Bacteroidales bacterium]
MKKDLLLFALVKKQFITFLCLLLVFSLSKFASGQVEMLVGGSMDDPDAWNVSHLDSEEEAVYEFNSNNSCFNCEGGTLNVRANGLASSNILFWQPVTLKANTVYKVSGAFSDLTGGALDQFWCEILIGTMEPEDSVDYPDGDWCVLGFNTWLNCGKNVDGTFQDDNCRGSGERFFLHDSLGDEATVYFTINVGAWIDSQADPPQELPYDVVIDNISMIDSAATPSVIDEKVKICECELLKNYPNPFTETTTITYSVPEESDVRLTVYNSIGKEVTSLVNKTKEKGTYKVPFDASTLKSDVYICRLQMNDIVITRKMVLLR